MPARLQEGSQDGIRFHTNYFFSGLLVILAPAVTHFSPIESALYRVFEVFLGGVTALAVSLIVFPARAHDLALEVASNLLRLLARALRKLLAGFMQSLDVSAIDGIQNSIGDMFSQLAAIVAEAKSERITYLAWGPELGPLLRTLLRLRDDLVIIGQAAVEPLPEPFRAHLGSSLTRVADTAAEYLGKSGAALLARREPPPLDAVERALDDYAACIGEIRQAGFTRNLPSEIVERIFALGFGIEQLRRNLRDLQRCVREHADAKGI
jgi:uncharacterized membrane protein YccC